MKRIKILGILLLILIVSMNSCKKTYDDGPAISFRSKFSRITGKWKLKSIEGIPRLHPETDQYMELTKEKIDDKKYKAIFTNFQEEYCWNDTSGEQLFNSNGYWEFYEGDFWAGCNIGEKLDKDEGLLIVIETNEGLSKELWKIKKLTNKELILINNVCVDFACYYYFSRKLIFEKE